MKAGIVPAKMRNDAMDDATYPSHSVRLKESRSILIAYWQVQAGMLSLAEVVAVPNVFAHRLQPAILLE
jgi:hypothetical protein